MSIVHDISLNLSKREILRRGGIKRESAVSANTGTLLGDWFMYDVGLATQNLCLAAHSLNLGTVIIGSFGHATAKEILGVPEGYEVVAMIPVGYPAQGAPHSRRREISEFVHHNTF